MRQSFCGGGHGPHIHDITLADKDPAHRFKDGFVVRLPFLRRDACQFKRFREDSGVGAAVEHDAVERDGVSGDGLDTGSEGVKVDAIAAPQQRSVDIEEVRVLRVPHESVPNKDAGFGCHFCCWHSSLPGQ